MRSRDTPSSGVPAAAKPRPLPSLAFGSLRAPLPRGLRLRILSHAPEPEISARLDCTAIHMQDDLGPSAAAPCVFRGLRRRRENLHAAQRRLYSALGSAEFRRLLRERAGGAGDLLKPVTRCHAARGGSERGAREGVSQQVRLASPPGGCASHDPDHVRRDDLPTVAGTGPCGDLRPATLSSIPSWRTQYSNMEGKASSRLACAHRLLRDARAAPHRCRGSCRAALPAARATRGSEWIQVSIPVDSTSRDLT